MNIKETPSFEIYVGNNGDKVRPDEPLEDLEPTPDLSMGVYLNASIVLPRGDKMAGGKLFLVNKTLTETQLDARTRIQPFIHVGMNWSLMMVK